MPSTTTYFFCIIKIYFFGWQNEKKNIQGDLSPHPTSHIPTPVKTPLRH